MGGCRWQVRIGLRSNEVRLWWCVQQGYFGILTHVRWVLSLSLISSLTFTAYLCWHPWCYQDRLTGRFHSHQLEAPESNLMQMLLVPIICNATVKTSLLSIINLTQFLILSLSMSPIRLITVRLKTCLFFYFLEMKVMFRGEFWI